MGVCALLGLRKKTLSQARSTPGLVFPSWLSRRVALGLPLTSRHSPHYGTTLAS